MTFVTDVQHLQSSSVRVLSNTFVLSSAYRPPGQAKQQDKPHAARRVGVVSHARLLFWDERAGYQDLREPISRTSPAISFLPNTAVRPLQESYGSRLIRS